MKITAPFLNDAGLHQVMAMLERAGHRALIVGGAVRNALLDRAIDDIDITTDARPEQVVELARKAGLKAIPTGIEHGTITVVAADQPFEITTFRRDIETDGRRATIAYSDRIEEDAGRRDFTMNALYADASGQIIDPVRGLPDLAARRLRFVGDPATRIREDYLRILRFFRFLACYADSPAPGGIEAIRDGVPGLGRVSAERIGAEMRKLLAAADPAPAMTLMAQTGVLAQILPGADPAPLPALIRAEQDHDIAPDWPRRLASLGTQDAPIRLRLSKAEAAYLARLGAASGLPPAEATFHFGPDIARDATLIRIARGTAPDPAQDPGWPEQIARAAASPLPIRAGDLIPDLSGPALGRGLRAAEALWIASGFTASRDALVDAARQAGKEGA
ncbi:MAG: CCA tRNA nucleotidyltransferase [Paracoccus sp. (in: a-proteobacteria)]